MPSSEVQSTFLVVRAKVVADVKDRLDTKHGNGSCEMQIREGELIGQCVLILRSESTRTRQFEMLSFEKVWIVVGHSVAR